MFGLYVHSVEQSAVGERIVKRAPVPEHDDAVLPALRQPEETSTVRQNAPVQCYRASDPRQNRIVWRFDLCDQLVFQAVGVRFEEQVIDLPGLRREAKLVDVARPVDPFAGELDIRPNAVRPAFRRPVDRVELEGKRNVGAGWNAEVGRVGFHCDPVGAAGRERTTAGREAGGQGIPLSPRYHFRQGGISRRAAESQTEGGRRPIRS